MEEKFVSSLPLSVAVIGAGLMGHAIAYVFAKAGVAVRIYDSHPPTMSSLEERVGKCVRDCGDYPGQITPSTSLASCVEQADLVIEAIAENLRAKLEVLNAVAEAAGDAILATNTSVISIAAISAGIKNPAKLVGTHWWNPPHLIDIVEVVGAPQANSQTVDTVISWLQSIGKRPVRLNRDVPGYIGNRLQFAMVREAISLVESGACDPATLDLVVRETFGRRLASVGPLENADLIGLDLTRSILKYILPTLKESPLPPTLLDDLIADESLGAKSGKGFFKWSPAKTEETANRLRAHLRQSRNL